MVITIDGPAGAGKSTIARRLAKELGFRFLDTGAMYRAVALAAIQRDMDLDDGSAIADLANALRIEVDGERVTIDGADVSIAIRSRRVTSAVGKVADQAAVRHVLIRQQRDIGQHGGLVTEGRDQGTAAFPNADIKFYLTASAEARAERRHAQLTAQGEAVPLPELLQEQNDRDERDYNRPAGPLIRPHDAIEIESDGLSIDQVIALMKQHVQNSQVSD